MANPDRARGFKPVRHQNGGSWNNALATRALIADAAFDESSAGWTMSVGTPVVLSEVAGAVETGPLAGLPSVIPMVDEDVADVYGVVVGIGRVNKGDTQTQEVGPWDPSNLGGPNYVTGAQVEADPDGYVLYVAPAKGWIFEVQNDGAAEVAAMETFAISVADDEASITDTTTGRSTVEIGTGDEAQVRVIEVPEYVDNDPTAANARLHVMFVDPVGAAESQ